MCYPHANCNTVYGDTQHEQLSHSNFYSLKHNSILTDKMSTFPHPMLSWKKCFNAPSPLALEMACIFPFAKHMNAHGKSQFQDPCIMTNCNNICLKAGLHSQAPELCSFKTPGWKELCAKLPTHKKVNRLFQVYRKTQV
ncbi:Hypothetical predicted protein [Podarcis lilfordi]|uniref:Uncharacterized protein n=1 Tax=Podarcis lilfordi TaxID=74358 RepID=A0AA35NU89_9SAUR|nr:Hypothetical predicted protein [Podarcis lilfordi]